VKVSAILPIQMADTTDRATERAEGLLKRIFERLGEAVDKKISGSAGDQKPGLSAAEIAHLETLLERSIDSAVVRDSSRGVTLAPNRFQVSLTHESAGGLGKTYLNALEEELRSGVLEFINNRRYSVVDDVRVEVTTDVLAKVSSVKACFSESVSNQTPSGKRNAQPCVVEFRRGTATYKAQLSTSGPAVNIGRLASCPVFVDDPSISRLHASIALVPGGEVVVSDLGSANGTSVNGEVVNTGEARKVTVGDVLTVGDIELTVAKIAFAD
jgi:FHA domain-containing protein